MCVVSTRYELFHVFKRGHVNKHISWYFYNVLAKDSSNMVIGHETVYTLEIIIPRNHTFEPEAL